MIQAPMLVGLIVCCRNLWRSKVVLTLSHAVKSVAQGVKPYTGFLTIPFLEMNLKCFCCLLVTRAIKN